MKALILAAGRGSRMRAAVEGARLTGDQAAAADAGLKALMPIGGRPFLDYVIASLAGAGIGDVALVVAPHHEDLVRRHYHASAPSAHLSFLVQHEPRGTADAVLAAEEWAAHDPFLVLNSDNIYPAHVLRALRDARDPAVPGFERDSLALPVARIATFALIERGPAGYLTAIVEKPGVAAMEQAGARALVSMNAWRFDSRIFDACRDVPVSERGEKELPQAVGLAASRGVPFEVIPVRGEVIDLSSRADVDRVTRELGGSEIRP